MLVISLVVNVAVLVPVLWGLASGNTGANAAFGIDTPARRILACIYLAIAVISAGLLVWPDGRATYGPGLLTVQVAYKLLTVAALGAGHPVAMANLAIAALHGVTLATILR
jgi:hypothetical protein